METLSATQLSGYSSCKGEELFIERMLYSYDHTLSH